MKRAGVLVVGAAMLAVGVFIGLIIGQREDGPDANLSVDTAGPLPQAGATAPEADTRSNEASPADYRFDPTRPQDGEVTIFQEGPVQVRRIAENCHERAAGWACDYRTETINPYEDLGEAELRQLAAFDPYAGLMLVELLRKRDAADSEIVDVMVGAIAQLPTEDKNRGWMHMMAALDKPTLDAPGLNEDALLDGYAWMRAGEFLGLVPIQSAAALEQGLLQRGIHPADSAGTAAEIASDIRRQLLARGFNPNTQE